MCSAKHVIDGRPLSLGDNISVTTARSRSDNLDQLRVSSLVVVATIHRVPLWLLRKQQRSNKHPDLIISVQEQQERDGASSLLCQLTHTHKRVSEL